MKAVSAIVVVVCAVIAMVLVVGLPSRSNAPEQGIGFAIEQAAGEEPFFSVDEDATGPLTLFELRINIPTELDNQLTPESRACFLQKIGELAEAAGDPETLDPSDVAYLPADGSWDDLTAYNRRVILAQAVVSRAITFC